MSQMNSGRHNYLRRLQVQTAKNGMQGPLRQQLCTQEDWATMPTVYLSNDEDFHFGKPQSGTGTSENGKSKSEEDTEDSTKGVGNNRKETVDEKQDKSFFGQPGGEILSSGLPPTPGSRRKGDQLGSNSNLNKVENRKTVDSNITGSPSRMSGRASPKVQQISSTLTKDVDKNKVTNKADNKLARNSKGLSVTCKPSPPPTATTTTVATLELSGEGKGTPEPVITSPPSPSSQETSPNATSVPKSIEEALMVEPNIEVLRSEVSKLRTNRSAFQESSLASMKSLKGSTETIASKSSHQKQEEFHQQQEQFHQQHVSSKATTMKFSSDISAEKALQENKILTQGFRQEEKSLASHFVTKSSTITSVKTSKSSSTSSSTNVHQTANESSESPIITEPMSPDAGIHESEPELRLLSLTAGDRKGSLRPGLENPAVNGAVTRLKEKMQQFVEKLKASSGKEMINILQQMDNISEKAWALPSYGCELGFGLCEVLRNSGGLEILVNNCKKDVEPQIKFWSAKLLEKNLSTENRSYVIENGLTDVVSMACEAASKSTESHERVGTGILSHLFKHSEEACKEVINLGGLRTILYKCRTSDIDTLRHCASALANLSLYGGPESHLSMIKEKAPMWLFPLAFHNDDLIKYYACLAIAALVANKEIEAAVLRSGTLDLVEPFVQSHNPQDFAVSSSSQMYGQSKTWLKRLVPVLDSDREEARSLAAFHFAMEAWIKKQQENTQIFYEIGAVEALKKVASSPNAIASKYAAQALKLIGEEVPHKLSQQVPLWTVDDVKEWVKQIGFAHFCQEFVSSRVDGDLLLQLNEEMLKEDIQMHNGILRKRFMRELGHLKRIADYSSCDTSNLYHVLNSLGSIYAQYTYSMLQCGVDTETLKMLSDEQLMNECKIENSIHRLKVAEVIRNLITDSPETEEDSGSKKSLDVFISYRRSNGSQLASLLKVHLQLRGFSVFIDVERLEAGKFDSNLISSIKQAKHFILVLTPSALDRCLGDNECKDWVHKEIVEALQNKCDIIPIIDNFQWPEPEKLPDDMRAVCYFNGVRWIHEYQDACVDKLERFLRGDANVRTEAAAAAKIAGLPGVIGSPGTPTRSLAYQGRKGSSDGTRGSQDLLNHI